MTFDLQVTEGPADPHQEGAFRRGYVHAVKSVEEAMRANPNLTPDQLKAWIAGPGLHWQKDLSLERQLQAPKLPG